MDYDTVSAAVFGHSLRMITVNLLCRDVAREVAFLTTVLGLQVHRQSRDFAILLHAGQPLQLHSDAAYASHPLPNLLPESGPRGGGIEIRLHEADPDECAQRFEEVGGDATGGVILQPPTDKTAHGLREAVILSPSGYAFIPSRRI